MALRRARGERDGGGGGGVLDDSLVIAGDGSDRKNAGVCSCEIGNVGHKLKRDCGLKLGDEVKKDEATKAARDIF